MVQIAKAWAVHRHSGEEAEIAASSIDKRMAGEYDFLCPDPCCRVPLSHYKEHLQTYVLPESDRSFRLKIPAHFQRKAHGQPHAKECAAVDDYTKYQIYARAHGGISHQHGAFVFNLNIPSDNHPAPLRSRPSRLTREFQQRALDRMQVQTREALPKAVPQSKGLSVVETLAGLLEASAFDPAYRDSILLRDGGRIISLSQLYKDDPVAFYREEHSRAKKGASAPPSLILFKPIAIGKYHSPHGRTVQGQAVPIAASNGKAKYAVSIMLHLEDEALYKKMTASIAAGERSFLVYTPRAYVSLLELAHKKRDMEIGHTKDRAVFVHAHIARAEQMMCWSAPDPQLSFDLPDIANTPLRALSK